VTRLFTPDRNLYPRKLDVLNGTNPEFHPDAPLLSKTLKGFPWPFEKVFPKTTPHGSVLDVISGTTLHVIGGMGAMLGDTVGIDGEIPLQRDSHPPGPRRASSSRSSPIE